MPDRLIQIEKRTGQIKRVRPGTTPIVELHLTSAQKVVSIELSKNFLSGDRKTDDWTWTAYISTDTSARAADV